MYFTVLNHREKSDKVRERIEEIYWRKEKGNLESKVKNQR